MIKGVSRQMIEVTATKNAYFERVLLVVRPSCEQVDEKRLRVEADRFAASVGNYSGMVRSRRRNAANRLLFLAAGAVLGGLLVLVCR